MIPSFYKSRSGDYTLIEGGCVETLSKFKFYFDMIYADPHYLMSDISIDSISGNVVHVDNKNNATGVSIDDLDNYNFRWLSACRDHLKDNGTIWVSGTHHNIFSIERQMQKLGFLILNIITWAKRNPPKDLSCRTFTHSTEFIIWARKSKDVPHYYNYELMRSLNKGSQMKDLWSLPSVSMWEKDCGQHPSQKPVPLLTRIIQASTKSGDWILDPFCGSGTTGFAASLLYRKFLGLDINPDYLAMSKARRVKIENPGFRQAFNAWLVSQKAIPKLDLNHMLMESDMNYGIPWI